ncbi:MAG: hypothetical protein HOQ24_11065 [Mycobacteriaceae bacterium]|nr:hypothetical protein [Mycobacteriaceae bacterium]
MRIRSTAVAAALATAVAVAGAGVANATPGTPGTAASEVTYRAQMVDRTVVTTLQHGTFDIAKDGRSVRIQNDSGREMSRMPLAMRLDGAEKPVRAELSADRHVLRLTPELALPQGAQLKPTAADRKSVKPIASQRENQAAASEFLNTMSIGTAVGSLLGLAAGAGVGVIIGIAAAAVACATIIGCFVAALPVFATVAAVGGILGTLAVGGPTLLYAAWEYGNVLIAPPGTTKYK